MLINHQAGGYFLEKYHNLVGKYIHYTNRKSVR